MYTCPRCNNFSVKQARVKKKLSFFFVPMIPLSSKDVYYCPICNWEGNITVTAPAAIQQYDYNRQVQRNDYMKS
ncbi:hypothetical protein BB560_005975 [Smittium megazygosporum]|uniref:Zinc-ribbon 15 domain-containing protein n=1 Tax=Smittium megazygosporum TaxID=133381 RepID=A0A2T9YNK2_9FUNG|nr:hypothetical protein BB560_005975 [Smittium megazygosporum]